MEGHTLSGDFKQGQRGTWHEVSAKKMTMASNLLAMVSILVAMTRQPTSGIRMAPFREAAMRLLQEHFAATVAQCLARRRDSGVRRSANKQPSEVEARSEKRGGTRDGVANKKCYFDYHFALLLRSQPVSEGTQNS